MLAPHLAVPRLDFGVTREKSIDFNFIMVPLRNRSKRKYSSVVHQNPLNPKLPTAPLTIYMGAIRPPAERPVSQNGVGG